MKICHCPKKPCRAIVKRIGTDYVWVCPICGQPAIIILDDFKKNIEKKSWRFWGCDCHRQTGEK
jgi:hypothetical protein